MRNTLSAASQTPVSAASKVRPWCGLIANPLSLLSGWLASCLKSSRPWGCGPGPATGSSRRRQGLTRAA